MENSTEFIDETKPLNPEALKKINSIAGDGSANDTAGVRDQMKSLDQGIVDLSDFEAVDFTSYKSLPNTSKYFVRVQEICNKVLNGYRAPFCSQDFRPISVPLSRQRVPVVPYTVFISSQGITGGGDTTFSSWMTNSEETNFDDFIISEEKFAVKMDEKTKSKLMTLVSIWSNEYLDKGVRDSRARPAAVLGDWAYALPPTFSMTERYIRTDVFASWMYGTYTATSPAETITIINNNDLRAFMNGDGGNYWPVQANTLCLALGKCTATQLTKLKLLGHSVIIDLDSSLNNSRGTAITYNGVPAWSVTANSANACDFDVAQVLNNTFSGIDIQWALFVNTLQLSSTPGSTCHFSDSHFDLYVYENTIADQMINFYATHRDSGNKIPLTTTELTKFIQAWRILKTVFVQRTSVEVGRVGLLSENNTYGKTLTTRNYYDLVSGCFSLKTVPASTHKCLWIPYEMWIMNGANLKLDAEDYVDGESSILVNQNYCVPRSQVLFTPTQWSQSTTVTSTFNYYEPNSATASSWVNINNVGRDICNCLPCTTPHWRSTTETQTLQWNKSETIDYTYVSTGKNSNTIYRKKLVFTSAVKN